MSDSYTETTTTGLGSRLMGSIKGIFFGLILFIVSFGLLYYNEGRQVRAQGLIGMARQSMEINATTPDQTAQGKIVTAQGILTSGEMLSDKIEMAGASSTIVNAELNPQKYLKLSRKPEIFVWKEKVESKTKKNLGGSETEEKTYTYHQEWSEEGIHSSDFKIPEGHQNPENQIPHVDQIVSQAMLGTLTINPTKFEFPPEQKLMLTKNSFTSSTSEVITNANNNQYIFLGTGSLGSPRIGDIRVSYTYLPSDLNIVAFGKLDGANLSPYVNAKNGTLYRGFTGTKEEALATMASENSMTTWLLRLLGFVLMWIGLSMLLGPISTFLDIIPAFGSVSRGLIGFVTFIVAFALSILTIIISMLLHNVIALVIAAIVGILIAVFVIKKGFKKTKMA
ncbi:hypothetical protein EXS71_01490 [Candidatus Uhrbacteria bacterium]|nr:hypothetical protein [Candidatus Uhrbacteria bacterium]